MRFIITSVLICKNARAPVVRARGVSSYEGFMRHSLITKFRPSCYDIQRATNRSLSPPPSAARFNRRTMMIRMYHCRAGHTVIEAHANMHSHVRRRRWVSGTSHARSRRTRATTRRVIASYTAVIVHDHFVVLHAIDPPALLASADHYSVPEIRGVRSI